MTECWWCGAELVWDSDYTSEEVNGETGDPRVDGRLVSILHCPRCGAEVTYEQPYDEE